MKGNRETTRVRAIWCQLKDDS